MVLALETMAVRSEHKADIHDTNRRQSGTALFLVRGSVGHTLHSLSKSSVALQGKRNTAQDRKYRKIATKQQQIRSKGQDQSINAHYAS